MVSPATFPDVDRPLEETAQTVMNAADLSCEPTRLVDITDPNDLSLISRKLSRRRSSSSTARSKDSEGYDGGADIGKAGTRGIARSAKSRLSEMPAHEHIQEEEAEEEEEEGEEELQMEALLGQIFGSAGSEEQRQIRENVGVSFENLTVYGEGIGATYFYTPWSFVQRLFQCTQKSARSLLANSSMKQKNSSTPTRILIHSFSGVVLPGEMCLVLGRPGSGCTTFLRSISGYDEGFHKIEGEVRFGDFDMEDMKKHYRGEVAFIEERDVLLATLTVKQTLAFAVSCRTPPSSQRKPGQNRKQFVKTFLDVLGEIFDLAGVYNTRVGNELIRGISGGEKKRTSISEVLAARSIISCWDNSTRGLDSSSAVGYVKALRALTNLTKGSTFVSLYQASDSLYRLFDKVLLIDQGQMVYFGPVEDAVPYFTEEVGYKFNPRQTATDFLASCTDPLARQPREGFEGKVPTTTEELKRAWEKSGARKRSLEALQGFKARRVRPSGIDAIEDSGEHERSAMKKGGETKYAISFWSQVMLLSVRQYQLAWGDKPTLIAKIGGSIFQSFIIGSAFYNQQPNTNSGFTWAGVLFISVLFQALQGLADLAGTYGIRPVLTRQKAFAFYRPGAFALARTLADLPIMGSVCICFSLPIYFLSNLERTASQYFIFLLFTYILQIVMFAFFRGLAALVPNLNAATPLGGVGVQALLIYSGYLVPYSQMRYYMRWIYWINPAAYGFESLMANQFAFLELQCAPGSYIPYGPTYTDPRYGTCVLAGSQPGQTLVSGARYIEFQFGYARKHLWRNLGAIFGFIVLFLLVSIVGLEKLMKPNSNRANLVEYKPGFAPKSVERIMENTVEDREMVAESSTSAGPSTTGTAIGKNEIQPHKSIYTWEDVNYMVPVKGGKKQLLTSVDGYVKPGRLTALMGASGAGKTTLLNGLSQRLPTATGTFEIDGKPLPSAFQRLAGFCEQGDIHDEFSTVREALRFSALLRQPSSISKEDKNAYCETVLELLELHDYAEARIGSGLNMEVMKRVTIAVELAARPALMLFLDEPTSGLDGQGAWNLVRFLRSLADAQQVVLATIHQPSAELFAQFDDVLLLTRGGQTVYFGPLGEQGRTLIEYFESKGGKKIRDKENPAEWMISQVTEGHSGDWGKKWLDSEECQRVKQDISSMKAERKEMEVELHADTESKFAASISTQFGALLRRTFRGQGRNRSYLMGKMMMHIFAGLFNGLTFLKIGHAIADLQNRLFTVFIFLTIIPALIQQLQPAFLRLRGLYEAREGQAKIYSWVPMIASAIIVELPISIFAGGIYFNCWWWMTELPRGGRAAFGLLLATAFECFYVGLGQALAALSPNPLVASLLVPVVFTFVALFCGAVLAFQQMPAFWRAWMPYLTPFRWLLSSFLSDVLHDVPVHCESKELHSFEPPQGETCGGYMATFFSSGGFGYITNPDAALNCEYCRYLNGDQYLATINIYWESRWRDFGYLCAYILFNFAMVFFFTWAFRIRSNPFKGLNIAHKAKKQPKAGLESGAKKAPANSEKVT